MNTKATEHPPSAIELLAEVLTNTYEDNEQDITDAITSIWLPVFRSEQNFAMALEALKISLDSANTRVMCQRYLDVMRRIK
jgi:hypothetical protein